MNLNTEKYQKFALCKEMLETASVVDKFDPSVVNAIKDKVKAGAPILLTGEGSSRIFPAKNAITRSLAKASNVLALTEGATQAMGYDLSESVVLGASNSGKTKEVIRLFNQLKKQGHENLIGLTANAGTPLEELSNAAHVLNCGKEDAVAATKSVVEQTLFVSHLVDALQGKQTPSLEGLSQGIQDTLTMEINADLIKKAASATTLYFAGRNDGVAEELTLKTNEITRKKSDYLEGTYAVHGIEEVMEKTDVLILINPFESEEEKIETCLKNEVGMEVIAISSRDTRFPTIRVPENKDWQSIIDIVAGWNILVEIGIELGIDLDKPERARKVGNEYLGE